MRRNLSILHVIRSPVGGVFRHVFDLATAQHERGHRVGLICDAEPCDALQEERIAVLAARLPLGVTRIPMSRAVGLGDAAAALRVASRLSEINPDVVHTHGAKGGVYGRVGAALQRRKGRAVAAFYAPHGGSVHFDSRTLQGRVYAGVERMLERVSDGLIHVCDFEAETYRRKVGVPRCPAYVVHNGLMPEEFLPVHPAADAADFLFIGELREIKGVDVFIEALGLLEAEGLAPRALVVGPGAAEAQRRYRELANAKVHANRVAFHAPMPARNAFALARNVVMPSRSESLPYVALEAVASGMPLVASNVGGMPEIFAGEAERLVAPGDPAALAAAMRALLKRPDQAETEAMLRRERVKQIFSLSAAVRRIEDIYRSALKTRYTVTRANPVLEADPLR